jgi:arylsulfatase A-like enzyme
MKHILITTIAAVVLVGFEKIQADTRPNIVLIMADDMGYGDAGCFGGKHIQTPNIDRLAIEGMRFTQCYAGSTVCAPSRSVLMTGLHTGHTRVRGNFGKGGVKGLGGGKGRVPLRAEDVTVAEVLKGAGYTSATVTSSARSGTLPFPPPRPLTPPLPKFPRTRVCPV